MKDQLISLFDEYVKNTPVETRKELYLTGWNGYYTKSLKSVSELPDDVLEMIETLHSEGELNDIEVFQEIQDDFAGEYLKEEYGVDMENADDEQIDEAQDNNFFTETGYYAFTNYIVSIVEEKYFDYIKEQGGIRAMEIVEILRDTFVSNGIIIGNNVDVIPSNCFDADIYQIVSTDEAWTISVYSYTHNHIDWTIDFNGTETTSTDLSDTENIINYLPVEHKKFWE
jgi:hypothetical protein